jgi:hypothetical protein
MWLLSVLTEQPSLAAASAMVRGSSGPRTRCLRAARSIARPSSMPIVQSLARNWWLTTSSCLDGLLMVRLDGFCYMEERSCRAASNARCLTKPRHVVCAARSGALTVTSEHDGRQVSAESPVVPSGEALGTPSVRSFRLGKYLSRAPRVVKSFLHRGPARLGCGPNRGARSMPATSRSQAVHEWENAAPLEWALIRTRNC